MVRSAVLGKPTEFLETCGFVFIITEEELQGYEREERITEWYDGGSEEVMVLENFVGSIYFDILALEDGRSLLLSDFILDPLKYVYEQFEYLVDVDYQLTLLIDGDVTKPIEVEKFIESRI